MSTINEVITTNKPYVIVNTPAAGGKTYCITERVKHLLTNGIDPSKIVMITFTNLAAEEMKERLKQDGDKIFIGTIHSYINNLLLSGGVYTGQVLDEENFDQLFELIIEHTECIKPIEYLLLDEAQDTDEKQWKVILDIIKPKQWMAVGDSRQNIFSWRMKGDNLFIQLSNNPVITTYNLLYNHRNGENILNYAKRIINQSEEDLEDYSIATTENKGKVIECEYDENLIIKHIKEDGYNYNDWFILTRTNAQLEKIKSVLEKENIPCDTFKRADLTHKELNKRMKQNTVKVLTIHSAKGLEAKAVVVIGTRFWNDEERRVNYVAATRAKELLIWTKEVKVNNYKKTTYKKKQIQKDFVRWE